MKIAQINPGHMTIPPDKWGAVEKIIWYYKLESEHKGHDVHIRYINEINRGDYDIVHVHMWNHALEMRDRGIPYIFTCHDHHTFIFGKESDLYKKNLEAMINAEVAIVPAKYLIEYFNNVPIYLRHGISSEEYQPNNSEIPHRLLCVGNNGIGSERLFDRKGFRYAIEAANKLNIPITIVGPTDNNKNFFEHNSDLKNSNVDIRYDLTDKELIDIYRTHTILVHPTSVEAGHPPLTVLEAASCGLPVLTTDCAGDLYTIRVNRDTSNIVEKINQTIKMYTLKRTKTMESVVDFHWSNVVDDLIKIYEQTKNKTMRNSALRIYNKVKKINISNSVFVNFVDGALVEIKGNINKTYNVNFLDKKTSEIVHTSELKNNMWTKTNRRWFTDWKIQIISDDGERIEHDFDPSGKKVFIVFESSSLGDTLAWIPYVEEFRKKYGCHVVVSTFLNKMFINQYQNLEFVEPGKVVDDLYALFRLGCFYNESGFDTDSHKSNFINLSLQEIACDILGLQYKEIKPILPKIEPYKSERPYVCIANHSTAQSKYWNNQTGWQDLVDYTKSLGYDVYLLSKEPDGYMGNKNPTGVTKVDGKSLEEIGSILLGSKGFIGLGSGLSWYSWSLGVPTILISGFSKTYQEMSEGIFRIINDSVCHGCFGRHIFDRGDWNWCPDHKGTSRQFECTKEITFGMVKPSLDKLLGI